MKPSLPYWFGGFFIEHIKDDSPEVRWDSVPDIEDYNEV